MEPERQNDGQQSDCRQWDTQACQGLAVIATRVSQAEAKPGRGCEGLDDQTERQTADQFGPVSHIQGEGREQAVDA